MSKRFASDGEPMQGILTRIFPTGDYSGSMGTLRGDDGKDYTWSAGQFFRNGSLIVLGARYRFTTWCLGYASDIDLIDKSSRPKEGADGLRALSEEMQTARMRLHDAIMARAWSDIRDHQAALELLIRQHERIAILGTVATQL